MYKGKSKEITKAFAYLRTSSATNVGADKDSDKRQLDAIEKFAKRHGYEIAGSYYDAAVSGADPIDERAGFAKMLETIAGNGVKTIIVETANRFARDLMVQEVGFRQLDDLGITLIAADSPDSFVDDTPTATLIRQVLGAVAQFDKTMTVAKLKAARERKSARGERGVGRHAPHEKYPEATAMAKRLRRKPKLGTPKTFRAISAELAEAGYVNRKGNPHSASIIKTMVEGPMPKPKAESV